MSGRFVISAHSVSPARHEMAALIEEWFSRGGYRRVPRADKEPQGPRRFDLAAIRSNPNMVFFAMLVVCVGGFLYFAIANFGSLFLMIEYRGWTGRNLLFNPVVLLNPWTTTDPHGWTIARSRALSFFAVGTMTAFCRDSSPCHDALHIIIVAGAAVFLALALRRLVPFAPSYLAVAAAAFVLFSEPMLEALSWQATILDKLSILYSAIAVYAVLRIDLRRADRTYVVATNIVLLLLVFVAYNTKEAALSLLPSMFGLLAIRFLQTYSSRSWSVMREAASKSLKLLAAPSGYAGVHIAIVAHNRLFANPTELARVTGGDPLVNFYHFALYMFNAGPLARALGEFPYASRHDIVVFTVAAGLVVVIVGVAIARTRSGLCLAWSWAMLSLVLALLIPIRTSAGSAFYLLVPMLYLAALLFVTIGALFAAASAPRLKPFVAAGLLCAFAAYGCGFVRTAPYYLEVAAISANFTAVVRQLQPIFAGPHRPSALEFYWPQSEQRAYLFLATPRQRALARFLLPSTASALDRWALDQAITDAPYVTAPPRLSPGPGVVSVALGQRLRLERLVVH